MSQLDPTSIVGTPDVLWKSNPTLSNIAVLLTQQQETALSQGIVECIEDNGQRSALLWRFTDECAEWAKVPEDNCRILVCMPALQNPTEAEWKAKLAWGWQEMEVMRGHMKQRFLDNMEQFPS